MEFQIRYANVSRRTQAIGQVVKAYLNQLDNWINISWQDYTFTYQAGEYCRCGRRYTESNSGAAFRQPDSTLYPVDVEQLKTYLNKPVLCQVCYYSMEYNKGRWAPRWVLQQLGIK